MVRAVHEPRPGFTNHHFNVVERDRVAALIAAARRPPAGPWRFGGTLAEAGEFRIEVDDTLVSIELPTGRSTLDPRGDLDAAADPPGSGGLLAALALWRSLLTGGPADLGSTTYWGTAPLYGSPLAPADETAKATPPLLDVLESAVAGVVARFFIDEEGAVVGIDLWLDEDADPCEVRLVPPSDDGLPRGLVVRRGTTPFATFLVVPDGEGR